MRTAARSNLTFLLLLALVPFVSWLSQDLNRYYFMILMLSGIHAILATSLNLVNGITGQFSLGHAGFMAIGAYVSASVTHYAGQAWVDSCIAQMPAQIAMAAEQIFFLFALVLGSSVAAGFGFLVGLPSLRLRGDYLAIVTLGFGEMIRVAILNIDAVGGSRGFVGIRPLTNFTWVFGATLLTIFTLSRLIHSRYGRAFAAIREDEIAAESVGISTTRYKVLAFVVSAFFAGLAGGLFAHFYSYINPSTFSFLKSFEVIAMVVLGGMGSLSGSVLAAALLTILPEALRPLQEITKIDFRMVIYSLLLIIMMLTRPRGLFGKREISDVASAVWKRLSLKRHVERGNEA